MQQDETKQADPSCYTENEYHQARLNASRDESMALLYPREFPSREETLWGSMVEARKLIKKALLQPDKPEGISHSDWSCIAEGR